MDDSDAHGRTSRGEGATTTTTAATAPSTPAPMSTVHDAKTGLTLLGPECADTLAMLEAHDDERYVPLHCLPESYAGPAPVYTLGVVESIQHNLSRHLAVICILGTKHSESFEPLVHVFVRRKHTAPGGDDRDGDGTLPSIAPLDLIAFRRPHTLRPVRVPAPMGVIVAEHHVVRIGRCKHVHVCPRPRCRNLVRSLGAEIHGSVRAGQKRKPDEESRHNHDSTEQPCHFHMLDMLALAKNRRMELSLDTAALAVTNTTAKITESGQASATSANIGRRDVKAKSDELRYCCYWYGKRMISPASGRPAALKKTSEQRKQVIQSALGDCRSVGADYLRLLRNVELKDPKSVAIAKEKLLHEERATAAMNQLFSERVAARRPLAQDDMVELSDSDASQ